MNKKLFLVQLLLLLSVAAYAATPSVKTDSTRRSVVEYLLKKPAPQTLNIDLHMRSSLHANFPNLATGKDETAIRFDYIVLDIHGEITPKLSYKYLQRLNKGSKVAELDNLSSGIDYLWIKYQFDDRFSVQAGRHALFFGGFEYEEYPVNVYDYAGIINNISCYLNGLSFFYAPSPTQQIGFQLMNNRPGSMTEAFGVPSEGIEAPSVPLYYSFAWNSSYADNRLKMRYAATAGELAKDKWAFFVSGGLQYTTSKVAAYVDLAYQRSEIDHLGVVRRMSLAEDGALWGGMGRNVEYLTATANLNYRFCPKWNFHLKGYYDRGSVYKSTEQFAEGNYLSSWGYDASMEFYPMADQNLHIYLNVAGKNYRESRLANTFTPRDMLRVSLGFVYRLPVL